MQKQTNRYFVVTAPGFENICAGELTDLGIQPINISRGGVEFIGGLQELYRANLWLRSASRILVRLSEVAARDFPTLFQRLSRLPWGRFIKPGAVCDIRVTSRGSRLIHTGRIAEVCQAAIEKSLGRKSGESGSKQQVFIRMNDNRCQVSVDSSGEHLHRRGYRQTRKLAASLRGRCLTIPSGYRSPQPGRFRSSNEFSFCQIYQAGYRIPCPPASRLAQGSRR